MNINIESLLDQADLQVAIQSYDKAITIYNQIIEADNLCDEAYLYRGDIYGKLGQTEKAFNDVHKAISIDPNYDVAHLILAGLYKSQNDLEKAVESCRKAIALNKTNKETINSIIQLYEMIADKQLAEYQPDKAAANYQRAIDHAPDNISLLYKHAFAVSRIGEFGHAIKLIEEILKRDSMHVPTRSLLVTVYEKTGQLDKGWQAISSLVQEYPANPFINITYGKYAMQNGQQAAAITNLLNALKQSGLKNDDQLSMHMLLGKLYDSISEYQTAFTHFTQANELKYHDYDVAEFEQQISSLIDYFSIEKYNKLPSSNNQSIDCVFILGMPRSGTSLIEQIISSHSKVYGGGELQLIPQLVQSILAAVPDVQYPQALDNISSDEIDGYANKLLASMKTLSPDSQKITDKLPHNFLLIGLIHKVLPNVKIINCIRNPVDTCLSCYFQHFGGYHPYAYNLSHLGKYYQQYQRLMSHWETTLEIPILNIRYEDVVNDTETQVKNIINYLELEWEDSCLEFYKNKRTVNTASYVQVEKKIYKGAVNRWRSYEPYISELINVLEK